MAVIGGQRRVLFLSDRLRWTQNAAKIYVAVKNNVDSYDGSDAMPCPWRADKSGFIGVWDVVNDNGDVPPRAIIGGPASGLIWPAGVAINPASGEVFAIYSVSNGLTTYHVPEFVNPRKRPARSEARAGSGQK